MIRPHVGGLPGRDCAYKGSGARSRHRLPPVDAPEHRAASREWGQRLWSAQWRPRVCCATLRQSVCLDNPCIPPTFICPPSVVAVAGHGAGLPFTPAGAVASKDWAQGAGDGLCFDSAPTGNLCQAHGKRTELDRQRCNGHRMAARLADKFEGDGFAGT